VLCCWCPCLSSRKKRERDEDEEEERKLWASLREAKEYLTNDDCKKPTIFRKSEKRERKNISGILKIRSKSSPPFSFAKVFISFNRLGAEKNVRRARRQKCVLYDERAFPSHDLCPLSPFTLRKNISKKGVKTRRDLVAFTFGRRVKSATPFGKERHERGGEGEFRPRAYDNNVITRIEKSFFCLPT